MCRWFAHPLGICESTQPLNSLFRLESRYSGPHLGLIHPKANWRNVENVIDTLWAQFDVNSSNRRHNRSSKPIGHSWIKSPHQSREDRLRNRHNWQPSHPIKESLKPEVLKLGEIDTSPWDNFPLSKFLFVSLIIFNGIEEDRVIPRLLASLRLLRLRWLSRALALSLGGARLSPRSHPKNEKWRKCMEMRLKPNARGWSPTWSPKYTEMRPNPSLRRAVREKKHLKLKTLGFRLKP